MMNGWSFFLEEVIYPIKKVILAKKPKNKPNTNSQFEILSLKLRCIEEVKKREKLVDRVFWQRHSARTETGNRLQTKCSALLTKLVNSTKLCFCHYLDFLLKTVKLHQSSKKYSQTKWTSGFLIFIFILNEHRKWCEVMRTVTKQMGGDCGDTQTHAGRLSSAAARWGPPTDSLPPTDRSTFGNKPAVSPDWQKPTRRPALLLPPSLRVQESAYVRL